MDLLIANHAVMPPTSLSAKVKYSSICSEKNENLVLAIQMGLGLSWKFNSPEERSIISRYEVRSVRAHVSVYGVARVGLWRSLEKAKLFD